MKDDNEQKFRYFAFFCYKDNLAERYKCSVDGSDVLEHLERELIQTFGDYLISPLHKPDDEQTREHYHVVYRHPGPCRYQVARNAIPDGLAYNNVVIPLYHPRNYQRYLLHLDNPEKEQFVNQDLTVVNNFPLDLSRDLSQTEKFEIQGEIESLACEFNIYEYATLTNYLREHKMIEHWHYLTTHTHHFGKYLDSLRYSAEQGKETSLDK